MVGVTGRPPDRGDICWLDFDPQTGHEQAGRRPALIVSPREYNRRVGLALLCPITSRVKGYPFEVRLPPGGRTQGAVLADQIKSLDWSARRLQFIERVPESAMVEAMAKLRTLLPL